MRWWGKNEETFINKKSFLSGEMALEQLLQTIQNQTGKLIDVLADNYATLKRSGQVASLGVWLAIAPYMAGCGDGNVPVEGDDDSTQSEGACGDSPLVGKNLMDIGDCKYFLQFSEDCSVTIYRDGAPSFTNCTYLGLEITCDEGHQQLYPQMRYTSENTPGFSSSQDRLQCMNQLLDSQGGYLWWKQDGLLSPREYGSFRDDDALVPTSLSSHDPERGRICIELIESCH